MKKEINTQPVQLISDEVSIDCDVFLALVEKNPYALGDVDKEWVEENPEQYKEIAQVAVKQNGNALGFVNQDWISNNSVKYKEVVQVAVKQNPMALEHIHTAWAAYSSSYYDIVRNLLDEAFKNNGDYYKIALAAVNKNVHALGLVDQAWISSNSDNYYKIVLEAMEQNEFALRHVGQGWISKNSNNYKTIVKKAVDRDNYVLKYVDKDWALKNSNDYYEIVKEAAQKDPYVFKYADKDWILKKSDDYYEIVKEAVGRDEYALKYVDKDWAVGNSHKYKEIVKAMVNKNVFALKRVDKDWAADNPNDYYEIARVAVNKNGNVFKYASDGFRNNIKIIISLLIHLDGKFFLNIDNKIDKILGSSCAPSKDILLYLYMLNNKTVSNNFKNALFEFFTNKFDKSSLFDKFNLSIADPSALKNAQLAKLLKNDPNDIIKNYLTNDTHNLKSIKNFNIYASLLPKNLFVVDYTKIIKKINENNTNIMKNDNLMRLVLCYFKIEDLLALSKALYLEDKPEVKYLDIDLEFRGPQDYISTGRQALVDAIKANNGSLRNTGKYKHDTWSPIYSVVDIELSQHNKLIEVIEFF